MKEIRKISEQPVIAGESRVIEGYAVVFDTPSTGLRQFTEIIHRNALDGVLGNCDVFALLDHNPHRGVLARSNKGTGSLLLSIDERGLKYSFAVPDTALGNEVYEGVRRGDIAGSSFSFSVAAERFERINGVVTRHIDKIAMIYDVSPVYSPAYDATEVHVDTRGLDAFETSEEAAEAQEETPEKEVRAEEPEEQEPRNSGDSSDEITEPDDDSEKESTEEAEEAEEDTEERAESGESGTDEDNENQITQPNQRHIMPEFSLISAINDVVEGRSFSPETAAVIEEGRRSFRSINQQSNGQIVLPVESRAGDGTGDGAAAASDPIVAGVATKGKEAVVTDRLNIVGPLRSAMVLSQAGATYLTGLVGDVAIPFYSGSNCGWKGEVVTADDGKGSFSDITLKPKRLTAFVDISKQFLIQDSVGAEELLRRDIITALAEKLEKTILGKEAGTDDMPAGVFNGVTADTAAIKYADVVNMEAALEDANVTGNLVYVVSPAAKATLRTTAKDSGSGRFIMEGGEVEGTRVLSSSAVTAKGVLLGDFRELIIGQWGGLDLTVDNISLAAQGKVRIVINAFFDAKVRRPAALQKKILK